MKEIPTYISLLFVVTTIATLILFYWALVNSSSMAIKAKANKILIGLIAWLAIQAALALKNIYNTNTFSLPPKIFVFGILPVIVVIIVLFLSMSGKVFLDSLPLKNLTWLNIVRIPVEIVLYGLFLHKAVPELMTFAGRNYDILSGITGPFMAYFVFTKQKLSNRMLLLWNFIALGLLINIVVNALLSAPTPLQRFAFDTPNIAILNFPFSLLPAFVVPVVLLGHLVSIRQLLKR